MEYAFIFGDSWTDTHFDPLGVQPSFQEPLGNFGSNSANASTWAQFLTSKYNASQLLTYNLASAGATLDNHILQGYPTPIEQQIYSGFMTNYANGYYPPWASSSSIFIVFAGIVDMVVMNAWRAEEDVIAINRKLTATYSRLLESLYGAGARNIVLMTPPPLHRTYLAPEAEDIRAKFEIDSGEYHKRIYTVAEGMKKYDDANIWVFDLYSIFNRALDDPTVFPQTSGIMNTTAPCFGYFAGTPTIDFYSPACDYPINQYMWFDALHPTYPIHEVIADQLVKELEKGPQYMLKVLEYL